MGTKGGGLATAILNLNLNLNYPFLTKFFDLTCAWSRFEPLISLTSNL